MNGRPTLSRVDVLETVLGFALVVAGIAFWSPPAAMVVAGSGLFVLGITGRRIV